MKLLDKAKEAGGRAANAVGNNVANAVNDAANTVNNAANNAADATREAARKVEEAARAATRKAEEDARKAEEARKAAAAVVAKNKGLVTAAAPNNFTNVGRVASPGIAPAHGGAEVNLPPLPHERLLNDDEKALARRVFQETLPYGAIYLSNKKGLGQRAYTIPHPTHAGAYVIHIGESSHDKGATDPSRSRTFIHELMHVWQGLYHGNTPFDYVCSSLVDQIQTGGGTYNHKPGQEWGTYTVEQQASIVDTWFADGMVENDSDKRWRYIRDHIRPATRRQHEQQVEKLPRMRFK